MDILGGAFFSLLHPMRLWVPSRVFPAERAHVQSPQCWRELAMFSGQQGQASKFISMIQTLHSRGQCGGMWYALGVLHFQATHVRYPLSLKVMSLNPW